MSSVPHSNPERETAATTRRWQAGQWRLRDQLFAHALRVRVGVGPAPVVGARHSAFAQAFPNRFRIGCPRRSCFLDELFVPLQFVSDRELFIRPFVALREISFDWCVLG